VFPCGVLKGMKRLTYIDWARGLACLLMFQTHCYDSWLNAEPRQSELFHWSQLLGTFPAPLFLFLAGISMALTTDRLRSKGLTASQVARKTVLRGAQIFALGLLFRGQEFLLGYPHAPWTDLLRVDILNTMGIGMMLMGALCRATPTRAAGILGAGAAALVIALLTPPLWTTWRGALAGLPWWLESYINGVHTLGEPQPWLFPIFPWAAFGFAGLATGFLLTAEPALRSEERTLLLLGAGGLTLAAAAWALDSFSPTLYAVYDFWHTSPNFFLIRLGLICVIFSGCYAWCQWGWGPPRRTGFSPVVQLGTSSLVVYWVHIEFVYGRFSILPKQGATAALATAGLFAIFIMMLGLTLAMARMRRQAAGG